MAGDPASSTAIPAARTIAGQLRIAVPSRFRARKNQSSLVDRFSAVDRQSTSGNRSRLVFGMGSGTTETRRHGEEREETTNDTKGHEKANCEWVPCREAILSLEGFVLSTVGNAAGREDFEPRKTRNTRKRREIRKPEIACSLSLIFSVSSVPSVVHPLPNLRLRRAGLLRGFPCFRDSLVSGGGSGRECVLFID